MFIDDFSPTGGTMNNQYAIPTSAGTNALGTTNLSLTLDATVGKGQLSLSTNGSYLVFAGYNAPVGTASVNTTPSINTGIGLMDSNGAVDTSTSVANRVTDQVVISHSASNPPTYAANTRQVTSAVMDGNNIWFNSTSANPYEMGVQYTTRGTSGSTNVPTQIGAPNSGPAAKYLTISGGQLYLTQSTGATSFNSSPTSPVGNYYPQQQSVWGPSTIGTGETTTPATWTEVNTTNGNTTTYSTPQTNPTTELTGFPTAGGGDPNTVYSFTFADGGNTIYLDDGITHGLEKWSLVSGTWTKDWSTGLPVTNAIMTGIAETTDGTNNYIYTTETVQSSSGGGVIGSDVFEYTDPIGNLASAPTADLLETAPTGEFFDGISMAPTGVANLPEPTAAGVVALCFVSVGRRRRRVERSARPA
jgi:hypothetical protein